MKLLSAFLVLLAIFFSTKMLTGCVTTPKESPLYEVGDCIALNEKGKAEVGSENVALLDKLTIKVSSVLTSAKKYAVDIFVDGTLVSREVASFTEVESKSEKAPCPSTLKKSGKLD